MILMAEAAWKAIDDCDRRMKSYRSTLDAGGDPHEIGRWMAGSRAERMKADGRIATITRRQETTEREMVPQLSNAIGVLERADTATRNDLYNKLGLYLVYHPSERKVVVEARPNMYQSVCPRGDLNPHALNGH